MFAIVSLLVAATGPATATLHYHVDAGAVGCPDEIWVRNAIRARLGRDPFVDDAPLRLDARITPQGRALDGEVRVQREGEKETVRQVRSATGDCAELASALELAITVIIDPLWLGPADAGVPAPPPAPPPPAPPPPAPLPVAPPPAPPRPVGLGAVVEVNGAAGAMPGVTAGLGLGAVLHWGRLELGLVGRIHLPTRILLQGGEVNTLLASASLTPCAGLGHFRGCLVGTVGTLQLTANTAGVVRDTVPAVGVGARAGWALPLSERLWWVLWAQAQALLTRVTVTTPTRNLWVSWPVWLDVGTHLELRFW